MIRNLRKTKLADDGSHYYEHTRDEKILPWREWCRQYLPKGSEGFTHEDVDGMVVLHGPLAPRGDRFMLIEYKWMTVELDFSQVTNFSMLHKLLRSADPARQIYLGFYIVEWARANDPQHTRINYYYRLDAAMLKRFFLMQDIYPSYFEMEAR